MAEEEYKPPTSAKELLERYAAGERRFLGIDLRGADLHWATLSSADFSRANFAGADLTQANLQGSIFSGAILRAANMLGVRLTGALMIGADLTQAELSHADLSHADLSGADLDGTKLDNAEVDGTLLLDLDLSPFCESQIVYKGPSTVDYRAVAKSIRSPDLPSFLQRTGMPEVFVEYMVECARAIDGSLIKKLLQSTFISYGGPDEPLARRLYESLHRNGVTTFFFPEHAKPGQRIGRVVRQNVESYDRILLLCSRASLVRPGVLYEIEETLERERRDGGAEYLIPVELDDCLRDDSLLKEDAVLRKDIVRVLCDRVCADFRGAQEDEGVFQAGLRRLIAALRPPDLALWRPPSPPKASET